MVFRFEPRIELSFHDSHGNACCALVDASGIASVTTVPLEIDAVIDEHVRLAMDLARDAFESKDFESRMLEEEQVAHMEFAADLQAEWSFVVLLPPSLMSRILAHEETLKAAVAGHPTLSDASEAALEQIRAGVRSVVEASHYHPAHDLAPPV